jgi:hypothetical protein
MHSVEFLISILPAIIYPIALLTPNYTFGFEINCLPTHYIPIALD